MGLYPYLSFTKLLRDGSREGLSRYAGALRSAITAWEGVAVDEVRFQPSDPLQVWCSPVADGRFKDRQMVSCRIESDPIREWVLGLIYAGAPRIVGGLFADDPGERLDDRSFDFRTYGDHLVESSVADIASSGQIVRGFESSIYLATRLKALKGSRPQHYRISEASPAEALIRAVEEVLSGGLLSREILNIPLERRKMRQFLARCDTEILECLGAAEFSRVLAPIGLTLKRWRKLF